MYVKPLIVFEIQYDCRNVNRINVFNNVGGLSKFLHQYDFTTVSDKQLPYCAPMFRLGTFLRFCVDGYECESDIKWGPRFIVGQRVRMDNKRIFITSQYNTSMLGVNEMPFHIGMVDAVVMPESMRQLWPHCGEYSRSELARFMTRVAHERYEVKVR